MRLTGQTVPMANLGPERFNDIMSIEFRDTISSIVEYNKHIDSISMSLTPYELSMVQRVLGNAQIQNARKQISPSSLQTIIDNVQNRIGTVRKCCAFPNKLIANVLEILYL